MEQIIKSFPEYEPDQLLTDQDLNRSFGYLEQQIRISRAGIGSIGKVVGYDYELGTESGGSQTVIKLQAGLAVSIEGNVLVHTNNYGGINEPWDSNQPNEMPKTYKYYVPYKKADGSHGITKEEFRNLTLPPFSAYATVNEPTNIVSSMFAAIESTCYLLLTQQEKDNYAGVGTPVPLSNITQQEFASKLLVLYREQIEIENSNCNQNSCNDEGKIKSFRTVTLLVNENDTLFPRINYIPQEFDVLHLKRFNMLVNNADAHYGAYVSGYNTVARDNLATIKAKLIALRTAMDDVPLVGINSFADLLLSPNTNPPLFDSIPNLIGNGIAHDHYNMVIDFQQAYNEFVELYNNIFINNIYEMVTTLANRRQQCVVLGRVTTPVDKYDSYGYNKVSISELTRMESQYALLKKFYDRLFLILFSFGRKKGLYNSGTISQHPYAASIPVSSNIPGAGVWLTPCKGFQVPLGQQSIRGYYSFLRNTPADNKEDNAFLNHWKGQLRDYESGTRGNFSPFDEGFAAGTNRKLHAGTTRQMLSYDLRHYPYLLVDNLHGSGLYAALTTLKGYIRANNLNISVIGYELNLEKVGQTYVQPMKVPLGSRCYNGVENGHTLVLVVSRSNPGQDYIVQTSYSLPFYLNNNNLYYPYTSGTNYEFDHFTYRPVNNAVVDHANWLTTSVYYNAINHDYDRIHIHKQKVVIPVATVATYTPISFIGQLGEMAQANIAMFGGAVLQAEIDSFNLGEAHLDSDPIVQS